MSLPPAERSTSRRAAGRSRTLTLVLLLGATLAILALNAAVGAAWMRTQLVPHAGTGARLAGASSSPSTWSSLTWTRSKTAAGPGYVTLDGSPGFPPVANPQTDTVYVPIQCQDPSSNATCNQTASHSVDVINSATCNASLASGCNVVASAVGGNEPISATLDPSTDTLYVGDLGGSGAITVVNGATCNAHLTSGCRKPLATIGLGGGAVPAAEALDPATGTLYVASPTGVVYAIAVAHCNATTTSGCGTPVKSIADSFGPVGVAVDVATDTVYATNGANFTSNTVSVIDGATCNATHSSGCGQTPPTVTVGTNPQWDVVDQATDTIYVANAASGSVSVINGATCNGTVTSGCSQAPPAVLTGTGDNYFALDGSRHTLFVLNQDNDTMSAIDVRMCNATHPSGCPAEARNEQMPFNPPQGGPPNSFALVPQTGTAYLVNAGGENVLQPVSISGCSALDTSACRTEAPNVPQHEFFPVVDAATHTIYAGNTDLPRIDVFNADTCKAGHLGGCTPIAEIPSVGPQANLDAIDNTTHTMYAGNVLGDTSGDLGHTISVINIAHCNATDTSGCHATAPTITVGLFPGAPVLDPATHTLYDVVGANGDRLSVVNTAHCNAQDSSHCDQHPATIAVPPGANFTALSQATDTIYQPSFFSNTVSVINGATCNASDHSGCGHVAANVRVGPTPFGVAVNDATHTVYVGSGAGGDSPGTVSIINADACNGAHAAGCTRTWPTVAVGRAPNQIALDSHTGELYVADMQSAAVSIINGNTCKAGAAKACPHPAPTIATAGGPGTLTVDDRTNTVYADNSIGFLICCGGTETLSVFRGAP